MIPNAINYKNASGKNLLILKNICSNEDCSISEKTSIDIKTTESYKLKR
jgi:hypothetical protein